MSFAWLLACSAPEPARRCLGESRQALFGGTSDAAAVLGLEQRADAIGRVWLFESNAGDSPVLGTWTATRIAPGWVLSAAHCVSESAPGHIEIDFAADQRGSAQAVDGCADRTTSVTLTSSVSHPTDDLVLMKLEVEGDPLFPVSEKSIHVGDAAVMSGFGLRRDASSGLREFLPAVAVSEQGSRVRVEAGPEQGACVGDSGGPLLTRASEGDWALSGVLSSGSWSCTGFDEFVRLEEFRRWIDDTVTTR